MVRTDDEIGRFGEWESLYVQLLDNSRRQLEAVKRGGEFSRMESALDDLFAEQERIRGRIAELEGQMREEMEHAILSARFRERILPLAEQLQSNLDQTVDLFRDKILAAGLSIQNARERKQATKAYSATDYDIHQAIFFDEKK